MRRTVQLFQLCLLLAIATSGGCMSGPRWFAAKQDADPYQEVATVPQAQQYGSRRGQVMQASYNEEQPPSCVSCVNH